MKPSSSAANGNGTAGNGNATDDADERLRLRLMALRRAARPRQLSTNQTEVLLMAVMRTNLLMRGPNGTGKRWIARHAAQALAAMDERVELLTKFFGVTNQNQIWIDSASLPLGMRQLCRATVLVVDDVPAAPHAAAAFFAHLDMLARVARCHRSAFRRPNDDDADGNRRWPNIERRTPPASKSSSKADLTASIDTTATTDTTTPADTDDDDRKQSGTATDDTVTDALESLPFGGLQILATQNADAPAVGTPTVAYGGSCEFPPSSLPQPSSGTNESVPPRPTMALRYGVGVSNAAPPTAPSPHADVFVVVFRAA